jgi:hypothetical protein
MTWGAVKRRITVRLRSKHDRELVRAYCAIGTHSPAQRAACERHVDAATVRERAAAGSEAACQAMRVSRRPPRHWDDLIGDAVMQALVWSVYAVPIIGVLRALV